MREITWSPRCLESIGDYRRLQMAVYDFEDAGMLAIRRHDPDAIIEMVKDIIWLIACVDWSRQKERIDQYKRNILIEMIFEKADYFLSMMERGFKDNRVFVWVGKDAFTYRLTELLNSIPILTKV